ncbi:MAG: glycosyltransferase [Paludibacteraceae bacterium]|nr:glycosyltransferase [Paludibacteraceae bacterium]
MFRHINHERFHVDFLIFSNEETDYTREVEESGHKVWRIVSRRNGGLHYYKELNKFFNRHGSDYHAIHWCGNSLSSMAPIFYAWKYGVPVRMVHAHNSSAAGWHNRFLHKLHRKFVARITTHHLACSSAAAKWFFPNDKDAIIINNGIDVEQYTYNPIIREKIRKELGLADESIVLGHVGRYCTEKNHTFLLDIFNSFLTLQNKAILMLIGKGELENEVKNKADELGISSHILFMGERSDVPNLMQAMDCFVLPSLFEGLPFVLVEAQAAGLPCFVSAAVNRDITLTPTIFYESIHATPSTWANKIYSNLKECIRTDTSMCLEEAGYSIMASIKKLENLYSFS